MSQRKHRGGVSAVGSNPHLRLRLSQLEEKLQNLADVVQNNTAVFAGGFDAADRRIYSTMRVLSDMAAGRPLHEHSYIRPGAAGAGPKVTGIDWNQYFTEYEVVMALIRLAEIHGPNCIAEETEEEDPATLVFGGDAP